jgi:hypothetical protein
LRGQLGITSEAFTQYLASEKKYFQELTEPSPTTTLKSQYVSTLLDLSQCRYDFTDTKNLSGTYPQTDRNGPLLGALRTKYSHLLLLRKSIWQSTRFGTELRLLTQNFNPTSRPLRTASTLWKDGLQPQLSTKHITKPTSRQIMREPLTNWNN